MSVSGLTSTYTSTNTLTIHSCKILRNKQVLHLESHSNESVKSILLYEPGDASMHRDHQEGKYWEKKGLQHYSHFHTLEFKSFCVCEILGNFI